VATAIAWVDLLLARGRGCAPTRVWLTARRTRRAMWAFPAARRPHGRPATNAPALVRTGPPPRDGAARGGTRLGTRECRAFNDCSPGGCAPPGSAANG